MSTDSVALRCPADESIMDTLSLELKSYLLEFLPLKYRLIMARMNRSWYSASLSPTLQRKTLFVYTEPSEKQRRVSKKDSRRYDKFMDTMMKSRRRFIALKLQKLNYKHLRNATIIENLGERITSLHVRNSFHFSGNFMDAISRCCRNLEKLKIESIRKFSDCNWKFQQIPSLKCIYFKQNRMCDRWFNMIIHCAPNLEELRLKHCRIETDRQKLNIIYPGYLNRNSENVINYNSKVVFSDVNITNYLKAAKNIKKIHLDDCLHILEQLPQLVKLNTLQGYFQKPLELSHFHIFGRTLNAHLSLKTLELYNVPILCFKYISELCYLNHLTITYWNRLKRGVLQNELADSHWNCEVSLYNALKRMKHLKTLKLRENLDGNNYVRLLKQPMVPEETLISIENLDITIDRTFPILTLDKNLKSLRLIGCRFLTFVDFIAFFKRVLNLNSLDLNECFELYDEVLMVAPISNIKGLTCLSLMNTKLTHHSLRFIRLFHLRHLMINISLEPTIRLQSNLSDFETSLKFLGDNNPNLEYIYIKLPESERECIRDDFALKKAISNTKKFKRYFKNLKVFDLPIKVRQMGENY